MKRLSLRSVIFGLIFAAVTGLFSVSVLADNQITPVERIGWNMPDSAGDTTDGGIRTPGPGH